MMMIVSLLADSTAQLPILTQDAKKGNEEWHEKTPDKKKERTNEALRLIQLKMKTTSKETKNIILC
jgi:hypothetical protein